MQKKCVKLQEQHRTLFARADRSHPRKQHHSPHHPSYRGHPHRKRFAPLGEGGRGVVFGFGLDMKETLLEFDGFILLCTFPIVNSKMQKKEKYIIDMERLPLRSLTRWPLEIHELNLCGLHSNKKVCEVAFATSHTFFSRVFFERVPFISYFPVLPRFVMGTPCLQSGHSSGL